MDSGSTKASVSFSFTGTEDPQGVAGSGLSPEKKTQVKTFAASLSYGTGSGQADIFICQVRTLNGGASEELDLYDATVTDVFGTGAAFRKVKRVMIWQVANIDGTTASSGMTIGAAATDPAQLWFGATNDTVSVNGVAGMPFVQGDAAGKAIGATSGHVKVANADGVNKLTYLFFAVGTSA
jgi:hypothetical protein